MIKVEVYKTNTGVYRSFSCKGHAGYADAGEDIVCAGVTAIVINTVNCLEDLLSEGIKVRYAKDGGDIEVDFIEEPSEKASFLIDCMLHGLKWIKGQYGRKYLTYEIKEV